MSFRVSIKLYRVHKQKDSEHLSYTNVAVLLKPFHQFVGRDLVMMMLRILISALNLSFLSQINQTNIGLGFQKYDVSLIYWLVKWGVILHWLTLDLSTCQLPVSSSLALNVYSETSEARVWCVFNLIWICNDLLSTFHLCFSYLNYLFAVSFQICSWMPSTVLICYAQFLTQCVVNN